jgi:hypothetical protein
MPGSESVGQFIKREKKEKGEYSFLGMLEICERSINTNVNDDFFVLGKQHEHHQVHEDKRRPGEGEKQAGHGRCGVWHGPKGQGDKISGHEGRR